jgi:outer membrane receptor protein involved in Fe transport
VRPLPQTPQQAAQGVVTVATPFDSRAVKAFVNDGRTDYRGVESLFRWRMSSRWSARGAYSFIAGNDLDPHRPVRRLPPQSGHLAVRHESGRRWWAEAGVLASGAQRRLSGGDLDDERIGAARSRNDIRAFLAGARVGEFLDPQGRFQPTGESVEQIVARVLPPGLGISDSQRVPLYTATPGWARFDLRGGWNAGEFWVISAGISNLFDRNFRVHGSGVDAPGRSLLLQVMRRW